MRKIADYYKKEKSYNRAWPIYLEIGDKEEAKKMLVKVLLEKDREHPIIIPDFKEIYKFFGGTKELKIIADHYIKDGPWGRAREICSVINYAEGFEKLRLADEKLDEYRKKIEEKYEKEKVKLNYK